MPAGVRAEPHPFSVRRVEGEYLVEGSLTVAVPPLVAWEVLTDYDDMSRFVVDMLESRVLEDAGGRLRVLQRGVTRLGPLSFDYEVEREVTLDPDGRGGGGAGRLSGGAGARFLGATTHRPGGFAATGGTPVRSPHC
jgi:hypothetical protein